MGNLQLGDVMCPICLEIFIEPITLCCKHELCKKCFEEHFSKADFKCPLCKTRLSTWARKQAKTGNMVNVEKWKQIQKQFASLLEKRKCGQDTIYESLRPASVKVSEPGEIKSEYLRFKEEWDCSRKAEDQMQERASVTYIKEILKNETEKELEQKMLQLQQDAEFASQLNKKINQQFKAPTTSSKNELRSSSKKRIRKPYTLHRYFSQIQKR